MAEGNTEGFLAFCSDETEWTYVGDRTIKGKEAVRHYLATTNIKPPKFTVIKLIAEGDFLPALGDITMMEKDEQEAHYSYCDVWRFRNGRLLELKAFVIKAETK